MPPRKRDAKATAKNTKALAKSAPVAPLAPNPANLKLVSTSSTAGVYVDHFVPKAHDYQVLFDKSTAALSCYLMWSDIKENHNKFYVAQALQHTKTGEYYLWTRYGRVGLDGVGSPEH